MIELLPTFLPQTYEEFETLVRRYEPFFRKGHLDVCDGSFVPNTTIRGYDALDRLETEMQFDIHLMVASPLDQIPLWPRSKVDTLIVHREIDINLEAVLETIKQNGFRSGLAINPQSSVEDIPQYLEHIDVVQFLTVEPGFYGRTFIPEVLGKVSEFHRRYPTMPIIIDGGVKPGNLAPIITAGATTVVSGSYLHAALDVGKAIEEFKEAGDTTYAHV